MKAIFKAGLLAALIYLPWIAWTWWYYGSPIPQTIVAKASRPSAAIWQDPISHLSSFTTPFHAIYFNADVWPWFINLGAGITTTIAASYWLVPVNDRVGRSASLAFLLALGYLMATPVLYPWYLPPATLLGSVAVARAIGRLAQNGVVFIVIGSVIGLISVGTQLFIFYDSTLVIQHSQRLIEDGHRKEIGMWLRENGSPTDRVYLEPLGYIGYFCNMHMQDWPGLVAPEVSQLHREGQNFETVPFHLKPEWVVLRMQETQGIIKQPYFLEAYRLEKKFSVLDEVIALRPIYGENLLLTDCTFYVFKRLTDDEKRNR